MSYSSDLKEKLVFQSKHQISELAGFLQSCAAIHLLGRGKLALSFQTESNAIARHYFQWIQADFQTKAEIERREQIRKYYRIKIPQANDLLEALGLLTEEDGVYQLRYDIPWNLINTEPGMRQYITGVFLGVGLLSNPNKSYHLEFVFDQEILRQDFKELLQQYDIEGRYYTRQQKPSLYLKRSESISDFLKIIGATEEALTFENMRVVKAVREQVQRKVNLETANITKTVVAAQKLIECIETIQRERGLSTLPEALREIAQLRWEEPDLTLKELGERLDPPISKSGVNHRLKRLQAICDKLAENSSKPTDNG